MLISSERRRTAFLSQMNVRFGLDHSRQMEAADLQVGDEPAADFARDVEQSVLPLMLRDAARAGLTIGFVRVQRRPTANTFNSEGVTVPPRLIQLDLDYHGTRLCVMRLTAEAVLRSSIDRPASWQ